MRDGFWRQEAKPLAWLVVGFLVCFFLPVEWLQDSPRLGNAFWEALYLLRWYAREHVLLCLIPAFFIAGAIAVFVSQDSVLKYLGAKANPFLAYGVASVSGSILAVCSCTVLPLFAGIYRMGAGLGPAIAFLYSGPAINVLAIVLTAKVLGVKVGVARATGAIVFSILIGLIMAWIFRHEQLEKIAPVDLENEENSRPLWQNAVFFGTLIAIVVFANWANPQEANGLWGLIYTYKWVLTGISGVILALILVFWFHVRSRDVLFVSTVVLLLTLRYGQQPVIPFSGAVVGLSWLLANTKGECRQWFEESWGFAKQIMPLLLLGILAAGALLGRPGHEALIPSQWVSQAVGGNSLRANFIASIVGAFMYFATLTEIPIIQGLVGSGMGEGPALGLLLAGPALSLPSILVLRGIIGWRKTAVFVTLVVVMATLSGLLYGHFFS